MEAWIFPLKKKNKITICNQRTVGPSFLLLKKIHSVVSTIRNDFNYVCKAVFIVFGLYPSSIGFS